MITQNPFAGITKGKIGTVVFRSWNGLNIAQTYNVLVGQKRSVKQLLVSEKLYILTQLCKVFYQLILIGYISQRNRALIRSSFLSDNSNVLVLDYDTNDYIVDLSVFRLSNGSYFAFPFTNVSLINSNSQISVQWLSNNGAVSDPASVKLYVGLIVLAGDTGIIPIPDVASLADLSAVLDIGTSLSSGVNIAIYYFWYDSVQKVSSPTLFYQIST